MTPMIRITLLALGLICSLWISNIWALSPQSETSKQDLFSIVEALKSAVLPDLPPSLPKRSGVHTSLSSFPQIENADLVQFIASNIDTMPGKMKKTPTRGKAVHDNLQKDVTAERLETYTNLLRVASGHLFPAEMVMRKLVYNAIDAYNNTLPALPSQGSQDKTPKVRISTNEQSGSLTVEDWGSGMPYHKLIDFFLLPMRSTKVPGQDIGQFGISFYGLFQLLDGPEDYVLVQTRANYGHTPIDLKVWKNEDKELRLSITEGNSRPGQRSGTRVQIQSKRLTSPTLKQMKDKGLRQAFAYYEGDIDLILEGLFGDQKINRQKPQLLYESQDTGLRLLSKGTSPQRLLLSSQGVTIKQYELSKSSNTIDLAIDIPSSMVRSADRSSAKIDPQTLHQALKQMVDHLLAQENYQALNSLYPLIKEQPTILKHIQKQLSQNQDRSVILLPDAPELEYVQSIQGKPCMQIHPEYLIHILDQAKNPGQTFSMILVDSFTPYHGKPSKMIHYVHNHHLYFFVDIKAFSKNHKQNIYNQAIMHHNRHNMPNTPFNLNDDFDIPGPPEMSAGQEATYLDTIDSAMSDYSTEDSAVLTLFFQEIAMAHPTFILMSDLKSLCDFLLTTKVHLQTPQAFFEGSFSWISRPSFVQNLLLAKGENPKVSEHYSWKYDPLIYEELPLHLDFSDVQRIEQHQEFMTQVWSELYRETIDIQDLERKVMPFVQLAHYLDPQSTEHWKSSLGAQFPRALILLHEAFEHSDVFDQLLRALAQKPQNENALPALFTQIFSLSQGLLKSIQETLADDRFFERARKNPHLFFFLNHFDNRLASMANQEAFSEEAKQRAQTLFRQHFMSDGPLLSTRQDREVFQNFPQPGEELEEQQKRDLDPQLQAYYLYLFKPHAETLAVHSFPDELDLTDFSYNPNARTYISQNASDINTWLLRAIHQHTHPYIFLFEMIKNAQEAGASKINFQIMQDDQGHLVLKVEDDGPGISQEALPKLYLPGISSKVTDNSSDQTLNFGWGWYTLFALFEQVHLLSQTEKGPAVELFLKKEALGAQDTSPNQRDHSKPVMQIYESSPAPLAQTGTSFYLKMDQHYNPFLELELESQLRSFLGQGSSIDVQWNGQTIKKASEHSFNEKNLLIEITDGLEDLPGLEAIRVYQSSGSSGKIFYKNAALTHLHVEDYLHWLPQSLQQSLLHTGILAKALSVELVGNLKQDRSRQSFLDQDKLDLKLKECLAMASADLLAINVHAGNNHVPFLSHDPYTMFQLNYSDRPENPTFWLDGLSEERKEQDMQDWIYNYKHPKTGYSLYDLHTWLKQELLANGLIDEQEGSLTDQASQEALTKIIRQMPASQQQKKLYQLYLQNKLQITRERQHQNQHGSIDSSPKQALEYLRTRPLKQIHALFLLENFLENIVNDQLKSKNSNPFKVLFFDLSDQREAYTYVYSTKIMFNLQSNILKQYFQFLEEAPSEERVLSWIASVFETLAHEFTHTQGFEGHDQAFFRQSEHNYGRLMLTNSSSQEQSSLSLKNFFQLFKDIQSPDQLLEFDQGIRNAHGFLNRYISMLLDRLETLSLEPLIDFETVIDLDTSNFLFEWFEVEDDDPQEKSDQEDSSSTTGQSATSESNLEPTSLGLVIHPSLAELSFASIDFVLTNTILKQNQQIDSDEAIAMKQHIQRVQLFLTLTFGPNGIIDRKLIEHIHTELSEFRTKHNFEDSQEIELSEFLLQSVADFSLGAEEITVETTINHLLEELDILDRYSSIQESA